MGSGSKTAFTVLRNVLAVSSAVAAVARRGTPPAATVEEEPGSEAVSWNCPLSRQGEGWHVGERLAREFPKADMMLVVEEDGSLTVRIPLRSLAREWGIPALPAAGCQPGMPQ